MVFKIRPSFYVFALRWSISSLYERTAKHKAKQEKADTDGSPKESHCVTSFSEIIFLFFNLEEIWDYASKRGQQRCRHPRKTGSQEIRRILQMDGKQWVPIGSKLMCVPCWEWRETQASDPVPPASQVETAQRATWMRCGLRHFTEPGCKFVYL